MKHGRAVIPFGKYKGVRIRLLPDEYLSWITTTSLISEPRWQWLKESILAELKYRGLRSDLATTSDVTESVAAIRAERKFRRAPE